MSLTRCPLCQGEDLEPTTTTGEEWVDGRCFHETFPAVRCVRCGEAAMEGALRNDFLTRIAEQLLREGASGPEALELLEQYRCFRESSAR